MKHTDPKDKVNLPYRTEAEAFSDVGSNLMNKSRGCERWWNLGQLSQL